MMGRLSAWAAWLGPVRAAFLASLLLSLVALQGQLVNRDGIYYLEKDGAILEYGLTAGMAYGKLSAELKRVGEWVFLPALIAAISKVTGLGPETAAHLLNALFLAGSCALLVDWVRRRMPEAAWTACLVVLALPAYNQYRPEILREFGFWFFCLLALWLAMRWEASGRWQQALGCQLALAAAALFRLESVAFYPALMLWQAASAPRGEKLRRALLIVALPAAATLLIALLLASGLLATPTRVKYYLEAVNPISLLRHVQEAAGRMDGTVFVYKFSREEAGYVLFFGLLSIIPVKFLKMTGVFLVPLAWQIAAQPARSWLARWQPLPWAFLAYLLVLAAFVTHEFFLVGRYVGLLNLLAVPLAASGLLLMMRRFPRWRGLMLALALLTLAANVVSLSPRKTHVAEAGAWLAANRADAARTGVDNPRIAYYAGWHSARTVILERAALGEALAEGRLDMVAVEAPRMDGGLEKWLAEHRLLAVQRFANKAGDAVIVAVPAQPQASPAMTPSSRPNTASRE